MVYPTKCTWGCCTCLPIFWRMCSTIGLPREPSLVVSPRVWSHCWRKTAGMFGEGDLDDYRPITLLNTELKILARVLANRLQLVISDLIGPEQNYVVKGRSIRDNLHLVCQILEGIKDDTKAATIGWIIGSWRRFWRPPDSNRSSANGWAFCTITHARNLAKRQRPSQDFCVRRWYHSLCVQASGHSGS